MEAVTWYLTLSRKPSNSTSNYAEGIAGAEPESQTRRVYLGGEEHLEIPVFQRHSLHSDFELKGPCIVEEDYTTTLVLAGDTLKVESNGSLIIEIGERNDT